MYTKDPIDKRLLIKSLLDPHIRPSSVELDKIQQRERVPKAIHQITSPVHGSKEVE